MIVQNNHYSGGSQPVPSRRDNFGLKLGLAAVAILMLVCLFIAFRPGNQSVNMTNREKLDLGYGYPSQTLTDELGWIANPDRLNRNLKDFYSETGALPYVALVSRPEITAQGSDAEWTYADAWYTENLPNEGYVLFMYFDPGTGEDGNGQLVVGDQAGVLFDAEAQQVFWDYMDNLWLQDIDEDTLFAQAFNKTAGRIMQRQTTGADVLKWFMIFMAIGAGISGVIIIMILRREHEAARAAETERILSTPLEQTSAPDAESDELLDKYSD